MSRMRQSYGMPENRRADSMGGAVPEQVTMERLERKEFDVPEPPIMIAMEEPEAPEIQSPEAEAAQEPIQPSPEDLKYVGVGETGLARNAAGLLEQRRKMLEDALNE